MLYLEMTLAFDEAVRRGGIGYSNPHFCWRIRDDSLSRQFGDQRWHEDEKR